MRFLKFAKILICFAFLCVCPVSVYADVSCPTGYVKISEPDSIIVTNASSCPSGHTKLSDMSGNTSVTNCTTGLSAGFCTYYSEPCQSGKYFDGTTHKTCIAGSYCDGSGTATPGASGCSKACPENSTSTSGATKCTCNTGYEMIGGACVLKTCESGYYLNGDDCEICPVGSYCANNIKTACDEGYTTDAMGSTSENQCYTTCEQQCTQQQCPDNATCTHGTAITTGKQYVGGTCDAEQTTCELNITCDMGYELKDGACTAIVCEPGYYLNGDDCEICPVGSYCANNIKTACDEGYTTDAMGSTSENQCYTTCEQQCTQQQCPENATCTHGTAITTGKQYIGGTCDAEQTTCELNITCDTGYELKDGACTAIVCEPGYYLNGDDCEICPIGSYCANNTKTACDDGYTTDAMGSTSENQCYTTCEQQCTQQQCPDNATCTHGTAITTGKQYVGGTCDAEQTMCGIDITCESGYYLNGDDCEICPAGTTSFAGASGIEQCTGPKSLYIGDDIQMNLTTVKPQTARVMVFDVLGELYYGGLSNTPKPINNGTEKQFRILDGDTSYWMHDYTVK